MSVIGDLLRWFSGGRDGYMSLEHCMRGDTFWIALTVILDLAVATGYALIARHWWVNEKSLANSQAKKALGDMKRIFLFCGTCGYVFLPIKMFWPAWRLYDLFMIGLVYSTWSYALNARNLRVVYHELGRSTRLAADLEEERAEARRKRFLLNAISHDMRAPLNGLLLQAELAEMSLESGDSEEAREALREIKGCARATADLLSSFLELGRSDWSRERTRSEAFGLDDLLDRVLGAARPTAEEKGLRLVRDVPRGVRLRTDRVKLERILQNLVSNAVKFTDRGEVEVSFREDRGVATLAVSDTGIGIPPELLATIFDESFQGHNDDRDLAKGFGLGLAIARRLARQLGAELTVASEVGRSSRFTLTMPGILDDGPPAPHPPAALARPSPAPAR